MIVPGKMHIKIMPKCHKTQGQMFPECIANITDNNNNSSSSRTANNKNTDTYLIKLSPVASY
jgi:hypothetical protein